nr:DUF3265 domain-containing protein [Vibrio nigripulchritudo]
MFLIVSTYVTNNLRVIQHAWHFWFGLSLVITMALLGFRGFIRTLERR